MEFKKYTSACIRYRKDKKCWQGILKYKDTYIEDGECKTRWRSVSKKLETTGKSKDAEKKRELELSAWHEEMEAEAQKDHGASDELVPDYVRRYIDNLASGSGDHIQPSTLTVYNSLLKYIEAGFRSVKLQDLDRRKLKAWAGRMGIDGKAPSTIRKAFNLLKAAMGEAVNDELIVTNPCDSIRPGKDIPKIPTREPNVLDAEQIALLNSFLDAAKPTPTNLGVRLALHTGMREGEICGLKWRNVDLESGVIKVRTVIGRDGGKTYVKEPKTERSKRDIPVSDSIIEALGTRRAEMARQCQEAAIAFSNDLYVLGKVDGSNLAPHALWEAWKAIAASLGLVGTQGKVPTFHDLRHTYATVAVDNGADPESVAHLLGHSKASMTLDVYATADKDAKILAAKKTSEALERKPKNATILTLKTGTDDK